MAMIYYILNTIYRKMRDLFVCSININMYDDTFKWVIKYIQEKNLIKADNGLKAKKKEDDEPWWEWIFNRHQKKKP